jgi:tetratricopeptide (TPR) repeat protein
MGEPLSSDQLTARQHCARGVACHARGDPRAAIESFDQALATDAGCAEAWNNRGAARHALGDFAGALADFDQALMLQPQYAEALNNRGMVRLGLGDHRGARKEFDHALSLRPRYLEALLNRAAIRHRLTDLNGAVADYDRCVGIRPTSIEALSGRAAVLAALNEFEGAAVDYDRMLELIPREAAAIVYHRRADVRCRQGRLSEALADIDRSLEIGPPSCIAYMTRGNIRFHLRDAGCTEDYRQAFALDTPAAVADVIRILTTDIGMNLDDVLENCRKHLRISPRDPVARARRGLTLMLIGREADAESDFELFRQQAPEHQATLELLIAAGRKAREESPSHYLRSLK